MLIAILGAGPTGLYFASLCEKHHLNYNIYESENYIGGQLIRFYPNKIITNIPNTPPISATDYINSFNVKNIHLSTKLTEYDKYDYIVNATGIGEYIPVKPQINGFDSDKVLYYLNDYSFLKTKHVAILGGGDSAIELANELSNICDVTVIHRRDKFRSNLTLNSNVKTIMSYTPKSITELDYDYIIVRYGFIPKKQNLPGYDLTNTPTIADGIRLANETMEEILNDSRTML